MSGYDLATGKEQWYIRRLPWQIKPTPIVVDDVVYFITFSGESDPGEQENIPPFAEALAKLDKNKDGKISKDQMTDPKAKERFDEYLDLDDSGFLEERDWEQFRERRLGESALRAYNIQDARGDITESRMLWKSSKTLPNVPSPLLYHGVLYTLKEGGIFTSIDPKMGAVLKQARLQGALGTYYASPVAADGKIYVANEDGKLAVLWAGKSCMCRTSTLESARHLRCSIRRSICAPSTRCSAFPIGIGGSLTTPPLPHHRTCGSASGGSAG